MYRSTETCSEDAAMWEKFKRISGSDREYVRDFIHTSPAVAQPVREPQLKLIVSPRPCRGAG